MIFMAIPACVFYSNWGFQYDSVLWRDSGFIWWLDRWCHPWLYRDWRANVSLQILSLINTASYVLSQAMLNRFGDWLSDNHGLPVLHFLGCQAGLLAIRGTSHLTSAWRKDFLMGKPVSSVIKNQLVSSSGLTWRATSLLELDYYMPPSLNKESW